HSLTGGEGGRETLNPKLQTINHTHTHTHTRERESLKMSMQERQDSLCSGRECWPCSSATR
ncbi:MAG: hypothetical protein ACK55Z_17960, partial [bacterium]